MAFLKWRLLKLLSEPLLHVFVLVAFFRRAKK
jgi:hypothetical protein